LTTEGKRHEVTVARQQAYAPGTILVMDRGYVDFAWFAQLTERGVHFVTRLKEGTAYDVVKNSSADPASRPARREAPATKTCRPRQESLSHRPRLSLQRLVGRFTGHYAQEVCT
jgi:Transposase DDE domain